MVKNTRLTCVKCGLKLVKVSTKHYRVQASEWTKEQRVDRVPVCGATMIQIATRGRSPKGFGLRRQKNIRAVEILEADMAAVNEALPRILSDDCGAGHSVGSRPDFCPKCQAYTGKTSF